MSYIHYKFKSAKAHDSLVVDGMGMTAFDLKREIVRAKKLKGEDFDLVLSNAESLEEYKNDRALVPRNSSIIVRRIPVPDAKKRGIPAGTAKYNTDDLHMGLPTVQDDSLMGAAGGGAGNQRELVPVAHRGGAGAGGGGSGPSLFGNSGGGGGRYGGGIPGLGGVPGMGAVAGANDEDPMDGLTEEERIRAVMSEGTSYWQQTQDKLGSMRRVAYTSNPSRPRPGGPGHFGGGNDRPGGPGGNQRFPPGKTPPPTYVCHRCGVKGHYIQDCPTNGDDTFNKPKIKRTTGIPKSFLREIDASELSSDGAPSAVMVNPEGKIVQFVSNEGEWNRIQSKLTAATHTNDDSSVARDDMPVPEDLQCRICRKLLKEAVELSCCRSTFCDSCIRSSLTSDGPLRMTCPVCTSKATPDNIMPSPTTRRLVAQFVRDRIVRQSQSQSSGPSSAYNNSSNNDSLPPPPPPPAWRNNNPGGPGGYPPPPSQFQHRQHAPPPPPRISQVNVGGSSLDQRISFRGQGAPAAAAGAGGPPQVKRPASALESGSAGDAERAAKRPHYG